MVYQQVILLSSVSLVGFFVGLLAKKKRNTSDNRLKKTQKVQDRQVQDFLNNSTSQEEFKSAEQHGNCRVCGKEGNNSEQYMQSSQYLIQQTYKCQVSKKERISENKGRKASVKKQGVNVGRTFAGVPLTSSKVHGSKGGHNPSSRDPLVDTLFKEMELLTKEKTNMQGEIENLRLQVEQLSELVTYLQNERGQESCDNSEQGEEIDAAQWLSGLSSTQDESSDKISPVCHELFTAPTPPLSPHPLPYHPQLVSPKQYQLPRIFEKL